MKQLIICRHAKSDWSYDLPDQQRPLNKRGKLDAPKMGRLLRSYNFFPDTIISSPAVRALTTAQLIAKELKFDTEGIIVEPKLYFTGVQESLKVIGEIPAGHENIMLFGHNPTQEALVQTLLQSEASITFPTCAMACFEYHGNEWKNISPQNSALKWFLIPRLIQNYANHV